MRCDGCKFWDAKRFRNGRAPCRIGRPKMMASLDPLEATQGRWPRTEADEYCGEHEPLGAAVGVRVSASLE